MNDIGIVKIFQSFNSVHELKGAQYVTKGYVITTYEFKVVTSIITDVLHDVSVGHPFGDHRESPVPEGIRNSDQADDVGMGQVLPHGDLFTEAL